MGRHSWGKRPKNNGPFPERHPLDAFKGVGESGKHGIDQPQPRGSCSIKTLGQDGALEQDQAVGAQACRDPGGDRVGGDLPARRQTVGMRVVEQLEESPGREEWHPPAFPGPRSASGSLTRQEPGNERLKDQSTKVEGIDCESVHVIVAEAVNSSLRG